MKAKVLELLKAENGWVSGQDICDRLEVSRTAVWKVMNQLKEDGYEIEAIRNKGYRLVTVPDLLTPAELAGRLKTDWLGHHLECHNVLGSTNDRAKEAALEGAPGGTVIIAEDQSAGKGRLGRSWESEPDSSIYMSLLLRPADLLPERAPMLTLVAALGVAEGIEAATGIKCGIKWPNDVIVNGKKICGILTEMSGDMDRIRHIVTGIGINVNRQAFPEELKTATSLYLESGKKWHRGEILCRVLESYERNYQIFSETRDFSGLVAGYNQLLVNISREVRVLEPGNEYAGVAEGINDRGELLVRTAPEELRTVISGEVSVRGLYGYV